MNSNLEELLRDGMSRFAEGTQAPGGLARTAVRLHRRRVTVRVCAAGGCFAIVAAAAVVLATGVIRTTAGPAPMQARDAAFVTKRVESAVSGQNLVAEARYSDNMDGAMTTWTYGSYYALLQYWPTADYRGRIVNGKHLWDFPPADRGKLSSAQGTAIVGGKLMWAYVTYNDQRYSLTPVSASWNSSLPKSACSTTARLQMGGTPVIGATWSQYINSTLRCGDAVVTGGVRISGHETTEITGKPVTVRLSPGYAKAVQEKWATVRWTLYVNPKTYLPVRMYGSTQTYGGQAGNQVSSGWADVTWLKPTPANIGQALVTIPPGFQQYFGQEASQ
jgi:hypothetical protein